MEKAVSKSIELRKVSRDAWRGYLEHCHEVNVDEPEALLEVFLTSPDMIRGAVALQRKREASARGQVLEIGKR